MVTDASEKDTSGSTKVTGSDASGIETNYVKASSNGDMGVSDIVDASALFSAISIPSGGRLELKVGASRLANRKLVHFQAQNNSVYLGYSNTVSASNGSRLTSGDLVVLPIGPNTQIWFFNSGVLAADVRIAELS